jgi:hypothetical protein
MAATPIRSRALVAGLIALTLLSGACGRFSRRGSPAATQSAKPVDYGKGKKFKTIERTGGKSKGKGTIEVFVVAGEGGFGLEGAIVAYQGPERGEAVTDGRGLAEFTVDVGAYELSLPRCGNRVLVETESRSSVVVTGGRTVRGTMPPVDWAWRYAPSPSVEASSRPPWKRGQTVTLGVRVQDGCDFSAAPGAALGTYEWRVTNHYDVVERSLKADGTGYARITVRCAARGDGDIVIADRAERATEVNLLDAISAPPDGQPFCK